MLSVVVSEWLPNSELDRLRTRLHVHYDPELFASSSSLVAALETAHGVIVRNRTKIDRHVVETASELTVVGRLGAGLDNVDVEACADAGVEVIFAPGINAVSVAEYVMGAMVALMRPVFSSTAAMVRGEWPRWGHTFGHELDGKTMGIIGYGSIGRHVAVRAAAFGMQVIAHDPYVPAADEAWSSVRNVTLDTVLTEADVISVHAALTSETHGLIDSNRLLLVKPQAVLINTSRGGTVDEMAVANALHEGRLAGAALDVFASEPLGPEAAAIFSGLDNLILTPHVSGNTEEAVTRVCRTIVDGVMAALMQDT